MDRASELTRWIGAPAQSAMRRTNESVISFDSSKKPAAANASQFTPGKSTLGLIKAVRIAAGVEGDWSSRRPAQRTGMGELYGKRNLESLRQR